MAVASYLHWEDSERALRLHRTLRYSWMPRALTGGIALIALLGGILAIVDRLVPQLGRPVDSNEPSKAALELSDSGLARDRTALAWTRSALNMAVSGTLIARAAFTLSALGIASAVAMAMMALLTWRHGQAIYRERRHPGTSPRVQASEFALLTVATLLTAAVAILVSIVI